MTLGSLSKRVPIVASVTETVKADYAASAGSKLSPAWFSIVREGGAGNAGRMRDVPPVLRHRISFACEQWPGDLSSVEPPLYTGFPACVSKPYLFPGTRAAGRASLPALYTNASVPSRLSP